MARRLFDRVHMCFSRGICLSLKIRHKTTSSASIANAAGFADTMDRESEQIGITSDQTKAPKYRRTLMNVPEKLFKLEKAVLMRKITRYEYEKQLLKPKTELELENFLTKRGSNYKALVDRHNEYLKTLQRLQNALENYGIELKTVFKFGCDTELIEWADAIFTAGGDGMFLMAASKVKDQSVPVIGINTDPLRSEGRLCLPKKYTVNFDEAIQKLLAGDFKWWWRQRIRIEVSGQCAPSTDLVDLHKQCLDYPEMRFIEHVRENEMYGRPRTQSTVHREPRPLPVLALNDVFVGESLSARVSFYEVSVDGKEHKRQKSSGITISTGTGSTSWFFNINHISRQSVAEIMQIASSLGKLNVDTTDESLMQRVADEFNKSLRFNPTDTRMAYTVRDPVGAGIFHVAEPRGFCRKMSVRSRMWDGWIVVDGGVSFQFNDGAIMEVSIDERDALCSVLLN